MVRISTLFFIVILFSAVLSTQNAFAQYRGPSTPVDRQIIINQQYQFKFMYKRWVEKAKNYGIGEFPFAKIVVPYSQGPDYDPYSEDTLAQLYEYAYHAQLDEDETKRLLAIDDFKALLEDHYGNIDVVRAAISLVRQNQSLGDLKFLKWLYVGLRDRVLSTSPGIDAYSAYDIYTSGEEMIVLQTKNASIISSEEVTTQEEFYKIYTMERNDTGEPLKVYLRLSGLMQGLIKQKYLEDPYYRFNPVPQSTLAE